MALSIRYILLLASLQLSALACADSRIAPESSRFIIMLSASASEQFQTPHQREQKLSQWAAKSGLALTLVPPSTSRRWVITANTENTDKQQHLLDIVNQDSDVNYIEADGIMSIQPIQRPIPLRSPPRPL